MSAVEATSISRLADLACCNVCQEKYVTDVSLLRNKKKANLPLSCNCCGFTWCYECVKDAQQSKAADGARTPKWIRCPGCRERTYNVEKPVVNNYACSLLDELYQLQPKIKEKGNELVCRNPHQQSASTRTIKEEWHDAKAFARSHVVEVEESAERAEEANPVNANGGDRKMPARRSLRQICRATTTIEPPTTSTLEPPRHATAGASIESGSNLNSDGPVLLTGNTKEHVIRITAAGAAAIVSPNISPAPRLENGSYPAEPSLNQNSDRQASPALPNTTFAIIPQSTPRKRAPNQAAIEESFANAPSPPNMQRSQKKHKPHAHKASPRQEQDVPIVKNLSLPKEAKDSGWGGFDQHVTDSCRPDSFQSVFHLMDFLFPVAEGEDNFHTTLWIRATSGERIGFKTRLQLRKMKKEDPHVLLWHKPKSEYIPPTKADLAAFITLLMAFETAPKLADL